jgi:ribosome biogenesis GTPase / thiamine phosphate phosphatase
LKRNEKKGNIKMDTDRDQHIKNKGIVYKKTIGSYVVHSGGNVISCDISARLRKELVYPTADAGSLSHIVVDVKAIDMVDPVAVGDEVMFVDNQDGHGLIVDVLPRRSKLVRRSAGRKVLEQVIVANLDQVVPVFAAAQPAPKWNLLDRYLTTAESLGLPSIICITKMDLVSGSTEQAMCEELEMYRKIGYRVLLTSVTAGLGMDEFKAAIQGKLSVFVGKSGVGKSSLLNELQPGLGIRVNAVSQATTKGKHTTTHLEMFPLDGGGAVVDTPGMREFGLWNVDETDLALFFPEIRPYVGQCKFGLNCRHLEEPGCAILNAVKVGRIDERRYHSFIRIRAGD